MKGECRRYAALLLAAVLLLALGGCATRQQDLLAQGGKLLNGTDLRRLVTGSVLDMQGYGTRAEVALHPDGTLWASNSDGESSPGRWRISDEGRLCLAFKRWGYREEHCFTVIGQEGRYYQFATPGRLAGSFRIVQQGDWNAEIPSKAAAARQTAPLPSPAAGQPPVATPAAPVKTPPLPGQRPALHSRNTSLDNAHLLARMAQDCAGCNLADADLAHADLTGARLAGATLALANLREAILRHADLAGADLRNADLRKADLRNADLRGADLTGALLDGALLDGARLDGISR